MEIKEVTTSRLFKEFLNFPKQVYQDKYPRYVTPLHAHIKLMIGKLGAPQKHLFLAIKEGKIVARCGFKVHKHNNETYLNFGFYECLEGHADATKAIFDKARSLYPDLPIRGPFHFRMEDPYIGVLVEGHELAPYFLMSYNPRYYRDYLEGAGLKKIMDLYTYELDSNTPIDPIMVENANKARANGYGIRTPNKKKIREEATIIAKIFNDALSDNWGFEEFIESQVDEMVLMFKFFLDLRVVALVHKDGKDVGCLIMIPNFNEMIKPAKGKVSPRLIWRYLNRYKYTNDLRGYALGVLKEHHGQGIGSLLVDEMYKMGPAIGYPRAEISWVLANNGPMNELSKAMNGKQNKVYRIYEKGL
jgi:GNAT superfamily N-acetyltransferase